MSQYEIIKTTKSYNHLSAVALFKKLWTPAKTTNKPEPKVYSIAQDSKAFGEYFDKIQTQLETLASMDDLLSGVKHVLLCINDYNNIIIILL